ncbi:MAG: prepilin-type N-terminal cleavage/methylation domain-containing protein [Parcubacteria group bacterium]
MLKRLNSQKELIPFHTGGNNAQNSSRNDGVGSLKFAAGFTLIEMVIVIAVIGILMGLIFRGVGSIQQNARDTRRVGDLSNKIPTQLELYFIKCGHYPTTGDCGSSVSGAGELSWSDLTNKLGEVVNTSEVPASPKGGEYQYRFGDSGFEYVLGAEMERLGTNRETSGTIFGLDCSAVYYCIRS